MAFRLVTSSGWKRTHRVLAQNFQWTKSNNNNAVALRRWFASYPPHEVVGMPSLSPTMESGSIASWNIQEGDSFGPGDILCSVETDKATVDFEAQDDGVVAKILATAGDGAEIQCGEPILITVEDEGDVDAFANYQVEATSTSTPPAPDPPAAPTPEPAVPTPTPPAPAASIPPPPPPSGGRVIASPLAHSLAKEMGHDITQIVGTGPGGRIIADDVREFVPAAVVDQAPGQVAIAAAAPIVGAGHVDYPIDEAARQVAAQLAHSKQNVPHYYLSIDITMDALLDMRKTLNKGNNDDDDAIGVYELIIKAAAASMKAVPTANASWMESAVRVYDNVDMNVVVGDGDALYTPVLKNVGQCGVKEIQAGLEKAMAWVGPKEEDGESTTSPPDFSMGTFTIMNLGMYGIKSCAPIIREPQACALALGTLENRIVPNDDEDATEIYKESVVMTATMSLDHRVVDGAVGAQWLAAFKSHVENPTTLLL